MAISTRLVMRQGQALVMTPQLLQAIKLLQFSSLELANFLQEELERNPILETESGEPPASESAEVIGEISDAGESRARPTGPIPR